MGNRSRQQQAPEINLPHKPKKIHLTTRKNSKTTIPKQDGLPRRRKTQRDRKTKQTSLQKDHRNHSEGSCQAQKNNPSPESQLPKKMANHQHG